MNEQTINHLLDQTVEEVEKTEAFLNGCNPTVEDDKHDEAQLRLGQLGDLHGMIGMLWAARHVADKDPELAEQLVGTWCKHLQELDSPILKSAAGDMILSDPGAGQTLDLTGINRFDVDLIEQLIDILDVSSVSQDDQGRIELELEKDLKSGLEMWWAVLNEQIEPANTDTINDLLEALENAVEENKRLEREVLKKKTYMARTIPGPVQEDEENLNRILAGRKIPALT